MLQSYWKYLHSAALALVLGAMLPIVGWAAVPEGLSAKQVEALELRVAERWQSMIDRDYGRTWEFCTPAYREVFPKALYVHNFSYAVQWELTSVEVVDYDAVAAVASVAVRVMSIPTKQTSSASKAVGAVPVTINERWIFIDQKWWHSANI
jgi:hypothetical protein